MKRIVLSVVLVFFACTLASAESSVWKAQKGNFTLYLGGTCHVLREADYPLPPEFLTAYRASDILVLETDLGQLQDPATQQKMLEKAVYADGSSVEQHLSAKAYRELAAYCQAKGIPLQALSSFRPSMIVVTLTMLELAKLGVTQKGVDSFFYELAQKDGKAVEGLETADQQIDFMFTMADGNEDEFVSYSIQDMKTVEREFDNMAKAWRTGDLRKLDQLTIGELKTQQPKLYKKLISDRNRDWLPLIESYRKTPRTRFILVGAAHLVGPDGIIESLRKKGYQVNKL
jgi:uncharacterized protein